MGNGFSWNKGTGGCSLSVSFTIIFKYEALLCLSLCYLSFVSHMIFYFGKNDIKNSWTFIDHDIFFLNNFFYLKDDHFVVFI